jgi:hypothetical protein
MVYIVVGAGRAQRFREAAETFTTEGTEATEDGTEDFIEKG